MGEHCSEVPKEKTLEKRLKTSVNSIGYTGQYWFGKITTLIIDGEIQMYKDITIFGPTCALASASATTELLAAEVGGAKLILHT